MIYITFIVGEYPSGHTILFSKKLPAVPQKGQYVIFADRKYLVDDIAFDCSKDAAKDDRIVVTLYPLGR